MSECYLCENEGTTREHLPPNGFFVKPQPSNLITVPACRPHNSSFAKIDERMRLHLSAASKSPHAVALWETIIRSLKRNEAQGFRNSVLQSFKYNEKGELGANLPTETDEWIIRHIRGLYLHVHGKKLSNDVVFFKPFFNPTADIVLELIGKFKGLKSNTIGNCFSYVYGIGEDHEDTSIWLLRFFDNSVFVTASIRLDKLTPEQKERSENVRDLINPEFKV